MSKSKGHGRRKTPRQARYVEPPPKRVPSMGICEHLGQDKQMYRNPRIAAQALAHAQRIRTHNGLVRGKDVFEESFYKCPRCQRWHLTSQSRRSR